MEVEQEGERQGGARQAMRTQHNPKKVGESKKTGGVSILNNLRGENHRDLIYQMKRLPT